LDEIYQKLDQFVSTHADIARMESLGQSAEGREIKAVHITDYGIPEEQKEVALVICGRHGNELGTRIIGLALLNWLASAEGALTRRRQLVVVVPAANPDGCVRQEFWAPRDGLSETEENTIGALARAYRPDAVIDVHSWGAARYGEAVVTANTFDHGEDVFIHGSIAAKMTAQAATAGYPFLIRRIRLSDTYNNFYCGMCYETFHSLVFGMEVNHGFLKPEEAAESGLAVLETFLNEGSRQSPWERYAGYPNRILIGNLIASVRATGADSADRRNSRCEIWRNRKFFTVPQTEFKDSGTVRVALEFAGEALSSGFALSCRLRGFPELKGILLNGKIVEPTTHRDNCSTYVSVDIHPTGKETYALLIEF
jgi:hypothetical protein